MKALALAVVMSLVSGDLLAGGDLLPAADDYMPREIWQPNEPPRPPRNKVKRKKRAPTRWMIRIEGEPGVLLIPIWVMQKYKLKPGATVSIETSRILAQELGAVYSDSVMKALEKLDKKPELLR